MEKVEDFQRQQVAGNPCPQQLPPVLKPGAPQVRCRSNLKDFLPTKTRTRGSVPAHPMNGMFPGPGLVPEILARTQMGQIVQKAQMKKRILPLQLKQHLNVREAPQVQHLRGCRRSSSHAHLRIVENFHAQHLHLDDQHPSLHPGGSSPGPSLL